MLKAFLLAVVAIFALAGPALAGEHRFHGYYVNRPYHHWVPRPYGEDWRRTGPLPSATALCNDGTSSFSEHPYAGGTCSYHGGVAGYPGTLDNSGISVAQSTPSSSPQAVTRPEPGEIPIISPYREIPMRDIVPCPAC